MAFSLHNESDFVISKNLKSEFVEIFTEHILLKDVTYVLSFKTGSYEGIHGSYIFHLCKSL